MLIVALANSGILTTNIFANTNIDFVDLIMWDSNVPCNNCEGLNRLKVTNSKQSNGSKKMLQAKMIQQRKQLSYQNSKKQNIYNIIFSHNFYNNLDIITKCNSQYYISQIQVILRSNNVTTDHKLKIREFMSRIII
jgi:hypothetical protein